MDTFERETRDKLTQLLVNVGKIEEHLNGMNGKLITHDIFIAEKCPASRKDFTSKLDNLRWWIFGGHIGGWSVAAFLFYAIIKGYI